MAIWSAGTSGDLDPCGAGALPELQRRWVRDDSSQDRWTGRLPDNPLGRMVGPDDRKFLCESDRVGPCMGYINNSIK